MSTAKTFPTPRIGKPRKSCQIYAMPSHRRARHRDARRGVARQARLVMAVARRDILRHQRRLSHDGAFAPIIFHCAIPKARTSIASSVFRWLRDHVASGVGTFTTMNGLYDWGWLRTELASRCRPRAARRDRRAGNFVDENLQATASTHCVPALRPPGQGHDTVLKRGSQGPRLQSRSQDLRSRYESYIWQLPAGIVAPYAEATRLTRSAI